MVRIAKETRQCDESLNILFDKDYAKQVRIQDNALNRLIISIGFIVIDR